MTSEQEALLWKEGWQIECYSPFEIRHEETGSFASGVAANIVVAALEADEGSPELHIWQPPDESEESKKHKKREFVDTLWGIVRQLRDKISEAENGQYADEMVRDLMSARSSLAGALGHLESVYRGEYGMAIELNDEERDMILQFREDKKSQQMAGWKPRLPSEYTDKEKIEKFEQLWELANGIFEDIKKHGSDDHDGDHWCYEAVMELLGDDVFKTLNKLTS